MLNIQSQSTPSSPVTIFSSQQKGPSSQSHGAAHRGRQWCANPMVHGAQHRASAAHQTCENDDARSLRPGLLPQERVRDDLPYLASSGKDLPPGRSIALFYLLVNRLPYQKWVYCIDLEENCHREVSTLETRSLVLAEVSSAAPPRGSISRLPQGPLLASGISKTHRLLRSQSPYIGISSLTDQTHPPILRQ